MIDNFFSNQMYEFGLIWSYLLKVMNFLIFQDFFRIFYEFFIKFSGFFGINNQFFYLKIDFLNFISAQVMWLNLKRPIDRDR